jgi:hypothetical protein
MTAARSGGRHDKPKCGAKKKQTPGTCGRPAGWGTDHPGAGQCKLHGGCMPNNRKAAQEQAAAEIVKTYGLPIDISPTDALLEEVRYTAGHVAWLREQVQALEAEALVWGMTEQVERDGTEGEDIIAGTDTKYEAKPNIWLELYFRERKHLLDVTKAAITVGIEERRVKLAEAQGHLVAEVIRRILKRLELSDHQQNKLVPIVVPEELRRVAAQMALN